MTQQCTWRVVNYDTQEIMESNSLGVIIRVILFDLSNGQKIDDMRFNHIDSPHMALNLQKYLDSHKRLVGQIKQASYAKNILAIKWLVKRYKEQYK